MDLLKYKRHWGMPDIIKSVDSHKEATSPRSSLFFSTHYIISIYIIQVDLLKHEMHWGMPDLIC